MLTKSGSVTEQEGKDGKSKRTTFYKLSAACIVVAIQSYDSGIGGPIIYPVQMDAVRGAKHG